MKKSGKIAVAAIVAGIALTGCGGQHPATSPKPTATASRIPAEWQQQQAASQYAADVVARDNAARQAFISRWQVLVNATDQNTSGDNAIAQLVNLSRYADSLKCGKPLHAAMKKLVNDMIPFGTGNMTDAQVKADVQAFYIAT
jgi:hypothetical protein